MIERETSLECQPASETRVCSSVLNYLGPKTVYAGWWGLDKLAEVVEGSEYEGMELFPLRKPVLEIFWGLPKKHSQDEVVSLHQSFHGGNLAEILRNNLPEALKGKGWDRLLQLWAGSILLYHEQESVDVLKGVQNKLGRTLPIVLYPRAEADPQIADLPFAEKLIQPAPYVMEMFKAGTVKELLEESLKRGYSGFAFDTAHSRSYPQVGPDLDSWDKVLEKFAGYASFVKEVHVSAGRIDASSDRESVMAELRDILDNSRKLPTSQMLLRMREMGWKVGLFVIEVPAGAIWLLGDRQGMLNETALIDKHKEIVQGVKDLLLRG